MDEQKPARLSPLKWMLGVLAFVIVVAGSAMLGIWFSSKTVGTPDDAVHPSDAVAIGLAIVGVIFLFLGATGYIIVLLSDCFTSNFHAPVFASFRGKLWISNLLVSLFFEAGVGFIFASPLSRVLERFVPAGILFPLSLLIPFFCAQLFLIWFSIWAPLAPRLIRHRLLAMGFSPQQISAGLPIGISDPSKHSMKKLTPVEEDIGLLWFAPDVLTYRGDTRYFDISREQLQRIDRKADAGSTSAYFGAVNIILHYLQQDGTQHQVRLHVENNWTMTSAARSLNELARRIEAWHAGSAVANVTAPSPT